MHFRYRRFQSEKVIGSDKFCTDLESFFFAQKGNTLRKQKTRKSCNPFVTEESPFSEGILPEPKP